MRDNPFRKAIASRNKVEPQPTETTPTELEQVESNQIEPEQVKQPSENIEIRQSENTERRKRGRPATGKRSDDAWIGRTFYIKRETDLDVEELLLKLKRSGNEVDKSELVDLLLSAWVKWQQGENIEIHLSEISPIQKYRK